jgi:maltose O-acetyltransferase
VIHPHDPSIRLGTLGLETNRPISIGDDVWIGANVTITPGVSIADKCIIGAGSVVTKSTGQGEMWFGNPARRIRRVEEGVDKIDWDE